MAARPMEKRDRRLWIQFGLPLNCYWFVIFVFDGARGEENKVNKKYEHIR
jgi:hypothetical protein